MAETAAQHVVALVVHFWDGVDETYNTPAIMATPSMYYVIGDEGTQFGVSPPRGGG